MPNLKPRQPDWWESASECAWRRVVNRDIAQNPPFRESLTVLMSGVPCFFSEYSQLHQPLPSCRLRITPRETVLRPLFLSSCLTFRNNSVPPSVDAWEPACKKGCSCLMIPWPELSLHSKTKQICSWVKGDFIINTEKCVVLGWTLGTEGVGGQW